MGFRRVSVALSGSALIFLAGCTENIGPAGIDGVDGKEASATCIECHAHSQLITAKSNQWNQTNHAQGTSFAYAGSRASCMACHNGSGSADSLSKEDSVQVLSNVTNINCRTCHQIHTTYSDTDWTLTNTEPVKSLADASVTFDFGKGNQCANCHQTRTDVMTEILAGKNTTVTLVGTDSAKFSATAARFSNHYGTQAQIIAGAGMWLPDGGAAKQSTPHGTKIEDGCVDCHMGSSRNHTNTPNVANCSGCHSSPQALKDTIQAQVTRLSDELRDTLIARGIAKVDSAHAGGGAFTTAVRGKTYPTELVGALVTWQTIISDGSKGVHNPKFTLYLLNKTVEQLKD